MRGSWLKPHDPQYLLAPRWRRRAAVVVFWCAWAYLLGILLVWMLLAWTADRWWLGTLILFCPRWLWALPLGVLAPAVAWLRPGLLGLLGVSLVLVVGPLMGFTIPWGTLLAGSSQSKNLRILTCNTHLQQLRPEKLAQLVQETQPDVAVLQELSPGDEAEVFTGPGWHWRREGELFLASRFPVRRVVAPTDPVLLESPNIVRRYELEGPQGSIHFFNVHLASPRMALEAMIERAWRGLPALNANVNLRDQQAQALRLWARQIPGPLLLAGDFNAPTESAIYQNHLSDYTNAFSAAGWSWGYTHYTRRTAVRIDHILAGPGWRFRSCWVGPNVGSSHRPLLADVEWVGLGN